MFDQESMNPPQQIEGMREQLTRHETELVDMVWERRDSFICWPKRSYLFMPGIVRTDYHSYTSDQKRLLKDRKITPDSRGNGPAVMSFLLAEGTRPKRRNGNGWPIHHVYDGQFPYPDRTATLHAVKSGSYFTEAAGLIAAHPIADGLALDLPYFAWLLRHEAFRRFEFDPDGVFGEE